HEPVAHADVDVEEERVPGRGDAHVGGHPALDGEEQRRAPRARPEPRDLVGEHPLQEARAIRAGRGDDGAEAEVDDRGAVAERAVLVLRRTEVARQRHAAVGGVRGAGPRQVVVERRVHRVTRGCLRLVALTSAAPPRHSRRMAYEDVRYEATDGVAWITI